MTSGCKDAKTTVTPGIDCADRLCDDTSVQPTVDARPTMSYARARLFLGTSCVGMWVILSVAALVSKLPGQLSSAVTLTAGVGQFIRTVSPYATPSGAFDLFGGYLLPKEYGRFTLPLGRFIGHWFLARRCTASP